MPLRKIDSAQREMNLLIELANALDGEITTLSFDPFDPASVELAILDMGGAIDSRLSGLPRTGLADRVITSIKQKYKQEILMRAEGARNKENGKAMDTGAVDPALFRQLENTVSDLRSAEYNSFDRHIKKLSRILHSDALRPISNALTRETDLDAWISQGETTQGGMVGSAKLEWPDEPQQELGLIILLVQRFADEPQYAMDFSFTFYYVGTNIASNIQNMVAQIIVPFARDYIEYVKSITGTPEPSQLPKRSGPAARKVFIVHGHDAGPRESVARFLEKINFVPVILHEQANQGLTIIEKIEAHSDVGFAVVLLTPDDVGGATGEELQPRARQNVLLELGYFVARLGRAHVCALKRGNVEVPSDFDGVIYQVFDESGGWKQTLARELEAIGFEIDWNKVMKPQKS